MKKNPRTRMPKTALLVAPILLLIGFAIQASTPEADPPGKLKPTVAQERASRDIARQLEYGHYRSLPIDKSLSSAAFDQYLKALDPQKLYFSQEDIDDFEPFRYRLDAALKSGQLDPAYTIYNQYIERQQERLSWVLEQLDKGMESFDFNVDERMELDREESAWASNQEELNEFWRKRIKSLALAQRLDGKSDEKIQESLTKRYQRQKKLRDQTRSEDVFQTYMNAVTSNYDPHTQYFSPRTSENFNINMSLSLEGIGAVLQSDNEYTKVVRLVPAGPADKSGRLKPADRIVGVGQGEGSVVNVVGWRLDDVVDLIRGPKHSTVQLEIIPAKSQDESNTRLISIVRDRVKLEDQSAKSEVFDVDRQGESHRFGIIHIPTFYADFRAMQAGDPNARSTTRDVERLIEEMQEKQKLDGLIIDLRNNGGGALQEAIALTGLFIKEGPTVQVRTADDRVRVYDDPDDAIMYTGPLAVLVNRMSASASEIFAAAIQDYGRGLIVGEQTFGKGTVQAVRALSQGQLKLTEAKFYRVSGGSTQHKGITPDIILPSAVDHTLIGEDALETALPWDQITPVPYRHSGSFDNQLSYLRKQHEARVATHPEFQALAKEIDYLTEIRETAEISLNEKTRREEIDSQQARELAVVNARRKAEGKELFKDYEALEDWQDEEQSKSDSPDLIDLYTREAAEIIIDSLNWHNQVADN